MARLFAFPIPGQVQPVLSREIEREARRRPHVDFLLSVPEPLNHAVAKQQRVTGRADRGRGMEATSQEEQ